MHLNPINPAKPNDNDGYLDARYQTPHKRFYCQQWDPAEWGELQIRL